MSGINTQANIWMDILFVFFECIVFFPGVFFLIPAASINKLSAIGIMKGRTEEEVESWELGVTPSVVTVAAAIVHLLLFVAVFIIYRYLKALLYEQSL